MNRNFSDPLWDHFKPLWKDFQTITEHKILVAGGHGLLLKQNWLLTNDAPRVIAHPNTWKNSSPRATKDLDLVVGLDLIAHSEAQQAVMSVLTRHGFEVGGREERNNGGKVREGIETSEPFSEALKIFLEYFKEDSGIAIRLVEPEWEPETLAAIRGTLSSWFV